MKSPVFTVVAHADDWQLFMGRDMFDHVADPLQPVVIIQLTAGDGGREDWYWKARQSGAVQSAIRATAGWAPHGLPSLTPAHAGAVHDISAEREDAFEPAPLPSAYSVRYDAPAIAGRRALRCTIAPGVGAATVLYFLHLPDGGPDGRGFARNGHGSLARLAIEPAAGVTARWAPVGAAPARYDSWDDLLAMLDALVRGELGDRDADVWVHTTVGANTSPADHADHLFASRAVDDLNGGYFSDRLKVVRFFAYATRDLPAIRNDKQRALVYAYAAGFIASAAGIYGWNAIWDKEFSWFGDREYWLRDGTYCPQAPPCGVSAPAPART